jgi:hypothetical protein
MVQFHAIPRPGTLPVTISPGPTKSDVLIAMTCKPYRREVVEAVDRPRAGHDGDRRLRQPASPIIRTADHGFVVAVDTPQFFPSSVSTIALSGNAAELCHRRSASDEIVERVERSTAAAMNWASTPEEPNERYGLAPPIRSLDARYYTDPQVFEVEKQGLLARTWQFACHASSWRNPATISPSTIAGEKACSAFAAATANPHLLQCLPAPRASAGQRRRHTRVSSAPTTPGPTS